MSNRISIEPTMFVNVRSGEESFGVRVYDDSDCFYDNGWESIPDDNVEVLREALSRANDGMLELLLCVRDGERGVYIGGIWFDWDDVKTVFEQE
jgi:hypothetical protein